MQKKRQFQRALLLAAFLFFIFGFLTWVNGTLIAHGEVVVVNEKFGIRMTDVISPAERMKKLR